jgi:hypothetical protein
VLGLDNRLDAARTPQRSPRSLAAEWAAFLFWTLLPAPITVAQPGIRTAPPSMNWNGVLAQNTPDTLPHHPWAAKAVRIIDLAEACKW